MLEQVVHLAVDDCLPPSSSTLVLSCFPSVSMNRVASQNNAKKTEHAGRVAEEFGRAD